MKKDELKLKQRQLAEYFDNWHDEYVHIKHVIDFLDVSQDMLEEWHNTKVLQRVKIDSGDIYYDKDEVLKLYLSNL